jgi:hypothetical protein
VAINLGPRDKISKELKLFKRLLILRALLGVLSKLRVIIKASVKLLSLYLIFLYIFSFFNLR